MPGYSRRIGNGKHRLAVGIDPFMHMGYGERTKWMWILRDGNQIPFGLVLVESSSRDAAGVPQVCRGYQPKLGELVYDIAWIKDKDGKGGPMTAAVSLVLDHLRDLHKKCNGGTRSGTVMALILVGNDRSADLAQNLGFCSDLTAYQIKNTTHQAVPYYQRL